MSRLVLRKAGAGSRGGHVIGHTKSGKPIYESHHARYASMHVHDKGDISQDASHVEGSFLHYTKNDHEEAASAHFKEAYKADFGKKTPSLKGSEHLRASLAHNRLANTLSVKKSNLSLNFAKALTGEGSRGGHVIGHTRSGKPIYASSEPTDKTYTFEDHNDAIFAHRVAAHSAASDSSISTDKREEMYHSHNKAVQSHQDQQDAMLHSSDVISHTRHGKPIFRGLAESKAAGANFNGDDHSDAEDAHSLLAGTTGGDAFHNTPAHRRAKEHAEAAEYHKKSAEQARGIIARTRNGTPIQATYSADHPSYKRFSAKDHEQAGNAHQATEAYQSGSAHPDFSQHKNASLAHYDMSTRIREKKVSRIDEPKKKKIEKVPQYNYKKTGEIAPAMGRTRSGKSVLFARNAGSPHYDSWSAEDHADAVQGHLHAALQAKKEGRARAQELHQNRATSHAEAVTKLAGAVAQPTLLSSGQFTLKHHKFYTNGKPSGKTKKSMLVLRADLHRRNT